MPPFRLAVFTNQFPGKVSTFFARDMRALIEAGIEVDVFAIYPHDADLWEYVPDILNESVLPRERVHHLSFGAAASSMISSGLVRSPGFVRDVAAVTGAAVRFGVGPVAKSLYVAPLAWAWSKAYAGRYDHILAYWGNYPGTCAYLFHRLTGGDVPFTLMVHAQIDLYEDPVYLAEKLLHADNIVTICEYNRAYLKDHYSAIYDRIADRIHVNYRGLDLAEFPFRLDGRAHRRVLAVGRLSPEKGYDDLLRAVAELRRRGVAAELELVGDGPERDSLTALANRLRITDLVHFRGWLHSDGVREAMLGATVLAQPSRIEGLPTVVEEAMALGIPVVGSRVGGIPELLDYGRCGVVIPPRDVGAIADALESLLADPTLRRTFATRARDRADEMLDLWSNGAQLADLIRGTPANASPMRAASYAAHA